jgi:hypothetical protein
VEATCETCGVLASGTGAVYAAVMAERASGHSEATGHETHVSTWASEAPDAP